VEKSINKDYVSCFVFSSDFNEFGSNLAFAEPLTLFHTTFVDSFSVVAQETDPTGVAFSSDGSKMFVVGFDGSDVNEYTLVTAFDVSTASFVDSFSVAGQDIFPINIAFSSDGTKMFVLGETGDKVNEYTLVTAFDVSTASFVDSFSVAGQETGLTGVAFSSDDTKMFVAGSSGDDVNEYNITLILPSCSPPVLGIWIIMESCEISSDIIAPASVMIQNNSVVIVNSGGSLIIPSGENIIIVNGSALKLIQGSNLQVNS